MSGDRHHRTKAAARTEQERGLRITTVRRDMPDLEVLARLICQMAVEDPLDLAGRPDLMAQLSK